MDRAIEIKRRAQRCIQNGDLDGAVSEYTKLVAIEDSDPYNFVLLADLLFKKGDTVEAGQRYLGAAAAYEKAGLYKNAIAVCKKLMRLQLAPVQVYQRLASAHALDGLTTEGSLYYLQHAEYLVRDKKYAEAAESLRLAYETSNENVKALERLAEVQVLMQKKDEAVQSLLTAVQEYGRTGLLQDAERCKKRAKQLNPAAVLPDASEEASGVPAETGPPKLSSKPPARREPAAEAKEGPAVLKIPIEGEEAAPAAEAEAAAPSAAKPAPPRAPRLEIETTSRPRSAASERPRGPKRDEDIVPTGATIEQEIPKLEVTRDLDPARVAEPETAAEPPSEPAEAPTGPPRIAAKSEPIPEIEPEEVLEPVAEEAEEAPEENADVRHEPLELEDPPAKPARTVAPVAAAPAEPPGLRFQPAPVGGPVPSLNDVERMLSRAQECFRAGQREAASEALAGAARAYDALGRYDSAATIYRSLGKSAHATSEVLQMWIENCERRQDNAEAAQVACELGDRALNEGQTAEARAWFERARDLDASNEVSLRRLQRLSAPTAARKSAPAEASVATPSRTAPPTGGPRTPEPPPSDDSEAGRVEVAVGRGEAVTFDLGSLISEFQRGVETQLSGDAQGHYDLAMSYREMGLLEQAVESFRVAARDPALGLRAMEMIGRCYLDQGRFDEAIEEFERALAENGLDSDARLGLHYEIGVAHQAAGRMSEALATFESIHGEQPDFPDVETKIRAVRKALGSS